MSLVVLSCTRRSTQNTKYCLRKSLFVKLALSAFISYGLHNWVDNHKKQNLFSFNQNQITRHPSQFYEYMGVSALSNMSKIQNLKMLKNFKRGSEIDSILKQYNQAIDDHSVIFCFQVSRSIIDVHYRRQTQPQKNLKRPISKFCPWLVQKVMLASHNC